MHKGVEFIPLLDGELTLVTTAANIPLTAAETSGRRSLATEETIRRPRVGRAGQAWAKGFREISKIWPVGIYIKTLSV